MRKRYFFGIGILLLCLAVWGIYKVYQPHHNVESEQPATTLPATILYREFQHDEAAANNKWVGKVVEVTGTITSVTESGEYILINLEATSEGGINCSFLKKDLAPEFNYKKGDSITIKGRCAGFLMDVNLVDCVAKN